MNLLHVLMLKTLLETLSGGSAGPDPEASAERLLSTLGSSATSVVCRATLHFDWFHSIPKICSSKVDFHFG